ncbi:Cytochrome c biogenesis protein CCS1, chloroplastic [Linum perenne]
MNSSLLYKSHHLLTSTFKFKPQFHRIAPRSLTPSCKLKSSRETTKLESGKASKKIELWNSSPPPLSEEKESGGGGKKKENGAAVRSAKKVWRKVLTLLSNLPLAIGEMFVIAGLMAVGTLIDQGESPEHYFQQFPEETPLFGFFTWRWVLTLGLDHMFSSPFFLANLALLGASLMACTYTTQIPLVKVARRWSFLQSAEAVRKQEFSDTLPKASVQDLGVILMGSGYEVFSKGPCLYAFKGLVGRYTPIGVHLAMILIMVGATISATGSFRGSVTVPQGLNFVVGDVLGPSGFLSFPTEAFSTEVHVNKFTMDYYETGEVSQYHTDLSLYNLDGKEVMRKTISVNDPLRSMLARDLQSIVLYDQEGKFVGVRRPNSKLPIEVDGVKIVVEDAIGSSGLELKTDPGVPVVYAGFGALMLTTCISILSHSQIWALQDGTSVVIGGKSNRAKGEFEEQMNRFLDQVPELVESPSNQQAN